MGISILDNFDYRAGKPNFTRDLFATVEEMVAFPEMYLPSVFECNVTDTGDRYRYNVNNDVDPVTGKWRLVTGGTGGSVDGYTKGEVNTLLNKKLDKPETDGTVGQVLTVQADGTNAYADVPTYDDTELRELIGDIPIGNLSYEIVETLPEVTSDEAKEHTLYMIKSESDDTGYNQYIIVDGAYKKVGSTTGGSVDGITVPTKTSDLTNDSGFITSIPSEYITETELETKGYLTEHQDISNLALKSEIPDVSSFITSDDLPTVPTKVSDLANDKNYISSIPSEYVTETELTAKKYLTSIPEEYITETELNAKGYLTSHQDISGLQTKTDNNLTTTSKEVVGAINEIKDKADLILDTEVRIDKTYSSSKIYSAIQDAIDSSKNFTLAEIGKMSGASYKVVSSTTEMTDEKIIYLLENDTTYDMYIVETAGTVTKIGDTAIDLSSYLKVTDAESAYLKKTEATSTYVAQTSFNNHINDTVAHLTQLEKNKLLTTDNITSTINNNSDNTQIPSAKATYDLANTKANTNHTHNTSDIEGLSIPTKVGELTNDAGYISEVIDNLTSTDTDKPLSANQGKILNDTKLNKTDANKLNCVTIDNVSLKEYILTNFTETEKTYHFIAKTTCTDLPKASNFYITVETPGLYTYKVTAKELNDSNGKYVCTYRTISSSWTAWEKVLITGDIIANDSEVVKKTDIAYTIDINSSDIKIPTVQAIYNDVIIGKDINQTVIDTYGTEILKYPLGIWRFGTVGTANKFSDLPVKTGGRIEITSIKADTNSNPWNSSWAYRVYNFETFTGVNYCRKVTSTDKPGIGSDTGWQKVCTTIVADVGVTTITPVNSNITGNIEYAVKNGVCYVSMKDLMSTTSSTKLLISTTMPKPSINCTASSVNAGGNIAMIYIDKNTTNLYGNFYTKSAKSDCSFSYPVAE